jgi:signal transduction histidine kinase/ActR/RegA family two-component response regulator
MFYPSALSGDVNVVNEDFVTRYYKSLDKMILTIIGIFGSARITVCVVEGAFKSASIMALAVLLAFVAVYLYQKYRKSRKHAFVVPWGLFLLYTLACCLTGDFIYFFMMSTLVGLVAAIYLEKRHLLFYLIGANVVGLLLVVSGFPLSKLDSPEDVHILLVKWLLLTFMSVLVYRYAQFGAYTEGRVDKAENALKTLFASLPNKMLYIRNDRKIEHISKPMATLVNLRTGEEAVGRDFRDLFSDQRTRDSLQNILENPSEVVTNTLVIGEQQYYLRTFEENQADEAEGRFVEIVDVTPIIEAKDLAEKANEAKTKFLSSVSHEMRTPLNAVIGFSELSLSAQNLSEEVEENLRRIHSSGKSLLLLINDILNLSKIESGKYELVPVEYSVANVIHDCMVTNVIRATGKPIEFIVNVDEAIPGRLFGDEMRVKEIFNNLLSNAFKYTNEGSVEWEISSENMQDGVWLVSRIKDTGIGIHPEVMESLFESFSQFDLPNNRKIEGTGLGLPITRQIVELMDGTLTVESDHGKGSTFTVRIRQGGIGALPLGIVVAKQLHEMRFVSTEDETEANLERPYLPDARVLIVDDITNNLLVAQGMMQPYGMKITCVTSGFDAIKLIKEARVRFDAVFMDQMMPEMDGIETTRIIREEIDSDYARNLPIIALTANAIEGNEAMMLERGFQAFISKPIDIQVLDKVICKWVRDRQEKG